MSNNKLLTYTYNRAAVLHVLDVSVGMSAKIYTSRDAREWTTGFETQSAILPFVFGLYLIVERQRCQ